MKKIMCIVLAVILLGAAVAGVIVWEKTDNSDKKDAPKITKLTEEELLEKTKEAESKLEENDDVIAVIGDFEVSREYYNFMYKSVYEQMAMSSEQYGENWIDEKFNAEMTFREYMKYYTIEQIKTVVATNVIAANYGITPEIPEVKKAVEEEKKFLVESCGGQEKYNEFLLQCRSDEKSVEKYVEQFAIYEIIMDKLTEENVSSLKADALEKFNNEYLKVQYIFISAGEYPQAADTVLLKSEAEAEFVAKSVIERLNFGEDFRDMMDIYNEDPAMTRDAFHEFTEESVEKELFEAAKNTEAGKYTKNPVKTSQGYYIIKRYAVDEKDENFNAVYYGEASVKANEIVIDKVKNLPLAVKEDVIDEYTDAWLIELNKKDN